MLLPITMTASQKDLKNLRKKVNRGLRIMYNITKFGRAGDIKNQYYWSGISELARVESQRW